MHINLEKKIPRYIERSLQSASWLNYNIFIITIISRTGLSAINTLWLWRNYFVQARQLHIMAYHLKKCNRHTFFYKVEYLNIVYRCARFFIKSSNVSSNAYLFVSMFVLFRCIMLWTMSFLINHLVYFLSASRLTGVTVKVSYVKPPLQNAMSLDTDRFSLCGDYKAVTKAGETVNIKCRNGAYGRYVYVYLPSKNFLTICEVEVNGKRKMYW